jgi:putative spermidine/putrescine transport system ATP-binding protein
MTARRDVLAAFRGVRKTFDGETLVVRNLDLDIYRGEFLTLLGPSGSGKTTTLMMLAGFETPTAGAVTLEGRDLTRLPPHKRDIGMVFQNYALFPHMTVAENIAFPLSVRGLSRSETDERIKRALGMVRLEGYEQRRPNQLSGGQQQRIALARALVFEPKLVLMDEPLGALDKQLREEMQLEIRHIHESLGVTVVYVTHDQAEALTMSDRIAVFHRGEVQQIDTPAALYERPRNAFVARFIGENNRLSGTLEQIADSACTVRLASGARIAARAVDRAAPGAAVIVSLRPERIALGGPAPAEGEINRLPATVRELIYLGDHIRARVELEGGESCMVKLPITQRGGALAEGARLDAVWRAEDGLAMAPEA